MNQQTPLKGTAAVSYLQDAMGHPLEVLTSFPKYIFIEPINTCNARCVMCGIDFDSFTQIGQERRGQDFQYLLDSSKARHGLGWHPQISLEEGIAEVSSWIDDEWERIAGEPLLYVHYSQPRELLGS